MVPMDNNLEIGTMFGTDGVSYSPRRLSARRGRVAQRTVECSSLCRQAEEVGGDFCDLLHLPTGELGIAIGDVSGKGVGAAAMMASLQAILRAEVRHHRGDLA